ncbi:MurR/RpiR family transcriptional regulator, partial [Leuconostoc falkenbergense]|uniref:MurR/RpiR family transcriptional regulator n=1 Tax=Leuconostoc falkenbergense TaxID=2766470 RepID=UPI002A0F6130|nr:MurR/RpiR family transcriptional regulator [Leuconostoc falkenbergense]
MNFSLSLKQHYDDLTDSEREVVSYLYDHMSEVKKMGIIEVAKKTLVSKSTVLRLSQKLGYSGFSEMKKYLTNLD